MPTWRYKDAKVYKHVNINYRSGDKFWRKKLESLEKVKGFKGSRKL